LTTISNQERLERFTPLPYSDSRHLCVHRGLCHASRPGPVGRPSDFRPRSVQPRAVKGSQPLAIHTLRRRTALLHGRSLRNARGHLGSCHDHSRSRNQFSTRDLCLVSPGCRAALSHVPPHS